MKWPDGEGLYLWIDRVVERDCPGGVPTAEHFCSRCHGTGKRRVRVRGWCEITLDEGDHTEPSTVSFPYSINEKYISEYINAWRGNGNEIRKAVIAAHFAGTLPDGVAHITEEVDE